MGPLFWRGGGSEVGQGGQGGFIGEARVHLPVEITGELVRGVFTCAHLGVF